MSHSLQYANKILFWNLPTGFEALLLAPFHVFISVYLLCTFVKLFLKVFCLFLYILTIISLDTLAVNRYTFPHSKPLSSYVVFYAANKAFIPDYVTFTS